MRRLGAGGLNDRTSVLQGPKDGGQREEEGHHQGQNDGGPGHFTPRLTGRFAYIAQGPLQPALFGRAAAAPPPPLPSLRRWGEFLEIPRLLVAQPREPARL